MRGPQVWFVHKRVCGENAKPFRFPAFSKGEVMEVKEILQLNETRGCLMRSVVVEGLEGSVGTDAPVRLFCSFSFSFSFSRSRALATSPVHRD